MEIENGQIRGQVSKGSPCWMKNHRMDAHGPGETDKNANDLLSYTLWPEIWKDMSDASKRKEKQKWAIEKPKIDNARKLRSIYFIDPADEEIKDIMKNVSWKFRCQQQCLAEPDAKSAGTPAAFWISVRQNTHAS